MRCCLVSCVVLLAACPDRSISEVVPSQGGAITKRIPVEANLDVLFVIDDSGSTTDKQAVFAANFPRFVEALDAFPGGRPNLHVGVVSSSVSIGRAGFGAACAQAPDGALQATPRVPGCAPPTGSFLVDVAAGGARTTNYAGGLDDALSCIAQLGATGCGFEAPLEAMRRALDDGHPDNAGFVRPGASLGVIFLTDEDDCSVADPALFDLDLGSDAANQSDFRCQPMQAYECDTPISATGPGTYTNCKPRTGGFLEDVARYEAFLTDLKDRSQLVVAAIAGDPSSTITTGAITQPIQQALALEPSCQATINGNLAIGRPAIRLADLVDRFGSHGLLRTVCQPDYAGVLADIGALLFDAISPCLDGPVELGDRDPAAPGLQLECNVSDVQGAGTAAQTEQPLPACPMLDDATPDPAGPRPCWWIAVDRAACPATETGAVLHVERATAPAAGTTVDVACTSAR